MPLLGTCSEILVALLEVHGITAVHEDGIVTIADKPDFKLALEVYSLEIPNVVQMDAIFLMGPGKVVREALLGFGESREAALMDAQQYFIDCVFHVWVSALLETTNHFVSIQNWTLSNVPREVTIGPVSWRGSEMGAKDPRWQKALQDVIQTAGVPEGVHWIDFYYAHNDNETVACEVLLDNEHWPALDVMREFDWLKSDEFYSVRIFMIVQGGFDCADALTIFSAALDEVALINEFSKVVAPGLAERYVRLGPLAFGRRLLSQHQIAVSQTAVAAPAADNTAHGVLFTLSDDWIYAEMERLARTFPGMMSQEQFESIAFRSAEVAVFLQAMEAGQSLTDARIDTPIVPFSPDAFACVKGLPSAKTYEISAQ